LLALPWMLSSAYMRYVGVLLLMGIATATAWNIMGGFTGYISLGHAAFFGLGAYMFGLTVTRGGLSHWLVLPLTGPLIGILALGLGFVAVQARGASFVIVTIALVYIFNLVAQGWRDLTGGSAGLTIPQPFEMERAQRHVVYYYLFGLLAVACLAVWHWIANSKFGLGLKAIREDEDKAESIGVPTTAFKVIAFAISAGLTATAGALYAMWFGFIDPIFVFAVVVGAEMVLMAMLGGLRSLWGPALGALVIIPTSQVFLVQLGSTQVHLVASGVLLAGVVLLMPDGIIPTVSETLARRRASTASPAGDQSLTWADET
jgi:branched-chain amino acid transport system permease protein